MVDLATGPSLFVTGGTGFFGKALLRHWHQQFSQGNVVPQVTLLTRSIEKFRSDFPLADEMPWVSCHEGDICRQETLPQSSQFDWVLHAATDSTNGPKLTPKERFDQIVSGTKNVLDLAVRSGTKRFLLTSSGGVYGPQPPEMDFIPESYLGMPDPLEPEHAYSVGKRMAEHLGALYASEYGFDFVVARCFAFIGRDLPLDVHFAIGNFIRDALKSEKIVVKGTGEAVRSYLDQRDLAEWLMKIMVDGKNGEAYNVGSDQAISIKELAYKVRDLLSPQKEVRIEGSSTASSFRNVYLPDIRKSKRDLGVMVRYPLDNAIIDAVA